MLKFSFSFPGKVILFGEHAVVYGEAAVASAISRRMFASGKIYPSNKSFVNVTFEDKVISYDPFDNVHKDNRTTYYMIRSAFDGLVPKNYQLDINIIQDFPTGGLGSSASLCACMAAIASKISNGNLSHDFIFQRTKELEKFYHGNPSGIDPATVVYGGGIKMENRTLKQVKLPEVPLLIVGTNRERNTKAAVSHVKDLLTQYPKVFKPLIKSMGDITNSFLESKDSDKKQVMHDLFYPAHCLLSSFGLSCHESEDIVKIAVNNALSAKISGAGMGGIMLVTGPDVEKKASLFSKYNVVAASIGAEGMREEPINFE
ncbi:mevalonate kinase family protein [Trichomonas vaginalis G3]|uniref:Mevalonate kinase n=1 Tax=Trichomonas vaginalis (strain ATCC PRA-98 / G3) TaxID=412133 RepID=A2E1U7_TRIV3|nr:mevalonate kinase protein [Trichomonas vaginalis G3]EAY13426.1 mevalonate kinase family protein [Trichomonas vaginalis G3]KAI5528200.1 mevalonate kinase protein [Trichomonas vaginalis G3]|eukprot:XP_001325649.1 mevalonate kinase family protein [Trichomonas vaginalis G3]